MWRADVSIPYYTGLPTDVVVNTFHFNFPAGTPDEDNYDDLKVVLQEFYSSVYGDASTHGLSPWMRPGATTLKIYNLSDPTPRTPVYNETESWPMTQSTGGALPTEVAICLSYQAPKVSGLSQARRRGRIYLGGWGYVNTEGTSTAFPKPTSAALAAIGDAAEVLLIHGADNGWYWNVWSRVNNSGAVVHDGWVDDAFDTQRRRGQAASTRNLWP